MNFLTRKKELLLLSGIVALYLCTRVIRLTDFPMLNDESIYLNWALLIVDDPKNLMIPLSEGRQPLFIWLISWYMRVFGDPLLAGRLVSVSAGLLTMLGIFMVTKEIFKKHSYAVASVMLYIVSPFALVYDRLALLDSLVSTFTIWSIFATLLFARRLRLDIAYTLGFIIGGGIITKSNGVFSLYLLPLSVILVQFTKNRKLQKFMQFVGLLILVFFVSQVVNAIITTAPQYTRILDVNQIFIIPKREFIKLPVTYITTNFFSNIFILLQYFVAYFTLPYLIMLAFGLVGKQYKREKIFLMIYFLVPLLIFSLFARALLPRYIYFMTIPLFPLCAYGFVLIYMRLFGNKKALLPVGRSITTIILYSATMLCVPIIASLSVVHDIRTAFIPEIEKRHYAAKEELFVKRSVAIARDEAKNKKVVLVVEGYIGWAPNMYQVLLHNNKNIIIKSYPKIEKDLLSDIASSTRMPIFVIIPRYKKDILPTKLPAKIVLEEVVVLDSGMSKADYYMRMYRLLPPAS